MAKRKVTRSVSADFAFFVTLHQFYEDNRRRIRQHYRDLSKVYLDFNDPATNAKAFLRKPQFEALEMYVFLKEFLDNAPVHVIFQEWRDRQGQFVGRKAADLAGQVGMLNLITEDQYGPAFDLLALQLAAGIRTYPNYIFALTMGTGKTILMATCIFYEFLLANKFPKDLRYCHNALVFAPDTTVLEALREIQIFDLKLVVPPEYVNFLTTHLQFHFLDEAGMALSTLDRSMFNLIISNTQKIILKRQHGAKSQVDQLFRSGRPTYDANSIYAQYADLYELDEAIEDETDLATNQRFEKLRRLTQLGIYVDEAHHAFGKNLAQDVGAVQDTRKTSLRLTIDELAKSLARAGTRVVACYNFTGTPYVEDQILPEVVYAYGLRAAIAAAYLKKVHFESYANVRNEEFVRLAIDDFLKQTGETRHEERTPKLAFFAATIDELVNELRPAVEKALSRHGIPASRILVNVGDEKHTTADDIREFNSLDKPESEKQFILLVGKGREGWNCRSLFGVALYRQPKSKIFVLQATMRCLRSIGQGQQTGRIYLSKDNVEILKDELQQNFRVTVEEFMTAASDHQNFAVHVTTPVKLTLRRVRHLHRLKEKQLIPGASLDLQQAPVDKYRILHEVYEQLPSDAQQASKVEDISFIREQRRYSRLMLVAEIARYLNKSPLAIEDVLDQIAEGVAGILTRVNEFNELLYDWVIPQLFWLLYQIDQYTHTEEEEIELVKQPAGDGYSVTASPSKVVRRTDPKPDEAAKSFHLDIYAFDSEPEQALFWRLLRDPRVAKVYFTGMLTHGQSDFYIQYIDPETHTLRSYYPDFLLQKAADGSWVIVEVKGDNKIDDPVVRAKQDFAEQVAVASGMKYKVMRGSEAKSGNYADFFSGATDTQIEMR